MNYLEKSKEIRACINPHYNCAQGVLIPFAPGAGLSETQAYDLARNFGAGMKMGATCGAITGGLMVLGLYGVDDGKTINQYFKHFRQGHEGMLNCADLLKASHKRGEVKQIHCDGMVFEAVEVVEQILKEKGKI